MSMSKLQANKLPPKNAIFDEKTSLEGEYWHFWRCFLCF